MRSTDSSPRPSAPHRNASTHSAPRYTPAHGFFRQHIRAVPQQDTRYWAFLLGGMVHRWIPLSYEDLLALPAIERDATLACAGSSPDKSLVASASWTGAALRSLLDEAGVHDAVRYAHLYAVDGYTTSVSIEQLQEAILAWGMNGGPLAPEHGGPVRLIVPGLYGYKMAKWIQRIILADTPLAGTWEQRGWPHDGTVQTFPVILAPHDKEVLSGPVALSGIAFAGMRSVRHIELSIEDGPWTPVAFSAAAPGVWTQWFAEWTPPAPGDYRIRIRVADEDNSHHIDSSAIHSIVIRITA